jgi:histidinol dehydrogenase
MEDGVELKQLTVGVDSVGLSVGAGLASAIVLMAISAASIVIVLIILLVIYFGCWL